MKVYIFNGVKRLYNVVAMYNKKTYNISIYTTGIPRPKNILDGTRMIVAIEFRKIEVMNIVINVLQWATCKK